MQIVEQREYSALCRGRNGVKIVETLLIGPQPEGTWILNFLGTAREVLAAEDAQKIEAALDALESLMTGGGDQDLDPYFADLTSPGRLPGGRKPDTAG